MDTPSALDLGARGSRRSKEYHNRDFIKRRRKRCEESYMSIP